MIKTINNIARKGKVLNFLLFVASLFGYLEWGNHKQFLVQIEVEIISKIFSDPISVIHPLVILPLMGQIILFYTLFQKKPSKMLTFIGIAGIGILLALMFFIGCIDFNFKILCSTVPFLTIAFLTIRYHTKTRIN